MGYGAGVVSRAYEGLSCTLCWLDSVTELGTTPLNELGHHCEGVRGTCTENSTVAEFVYSFDGWDSSGPEMSISAFTDICSAELGTSSWVETVRSDEHYVCAVVETGFSTDEVGA